MTVDEIVSGGVIFRRINKNKLRSDNNNNNENIKGNCLKCHMRADR